MNTVSYVGIGDHYKMLVSREYGSRYTRLEFNNHRDLPVAIYLSPERLLELRELLDWGFGIDTGVKE